MEDQQVHVTAPYQDQLLALLDRESDPSKGLVSVNSDQIRGDVVAVWLSNSSNEHTLGLEVNGDNSVVLFLRKDNSLIPCSASDFGQALENGRMSKGSNLGYDMQANMSLAFRFISDNNLEVRPLRNLPI